MASKTQLVTLMPIRNMDRAIKFYTKKLGAKLLYRGEGEMKDGFAGLRLAGHEIWFVAPQKWEKRKLAYTSFLVSSLKPFVKKLQGKGVKFAKAERMGPQTKVDGPIAIESFGSSAFFQDSEGNLLMAWQNNPAM